MRVEPVQVGWDEHLSICGSHAYLKAVGDEFGWLGGFDDMGQLRCVLPYTILCRSFLRLVRFRVETIPIKGALGLEQEKDFLDAAGKWFRKIGCHVIVPASNNTLFRTYPKRAVVVPYGSYIVDLRQPEEIMWNNVHSKHRNVIRNAIKKGVRIESGIECIELAHKMIRRTLERSSLRFMNYSKFHDYVRSLGKNVRILMAIYQGVPQGCAVVPFSQFCAYYFYGGSIEAPLAGSMNLLHWEAMKAFKLRGVDYYDFVGARINPDPGSKQEQLARFKQRFGGRLATGYMWKLCLRPLGAIAYSVGVRLLRGGDIVDIERRRMALAVEATRDLGIVPVSDVSPRVEHN